MESPTKTNPPTSGCRRLSGLKKRTRRAIRCQPGCRMRGASIRFSESLWEAGRMPNRKIKSGLSNNVYYDAPHLHSVSNRSQSMAYFK